MKVLKLVVGGIILGTVLFFAAPFILIVMILKFIFTPFGLSRMMMYRRFGNHFIMEPEMKFSMAEKIRNMSEEEFDTFKNRMNFRYGHCQRNFYNQKNEENGK